MIRFIAVFGFLFWAQFSVSEEAQLIEEKPIDRDEIIKVHKAVYQDQFPSAATCATCHPRHYEEWARSPHAYAQKSPVFGGMHRALVKKTNGTLGDFCIRCHTPIGMQLGESIKSSNLFRSQVSVEGVTCVVCHRVNPGLGTVSSRFHIREGDADAPNHGPTGQKSMQKRILKQGLKPSEVHDVITHYALSSSTFCQSCHDVFGENGFHLEDANNKYLSSPAAKKGITCQDCHMGKSPGKNEGYAVDSVAYFNGVPTPKRKTTSHSFAGPDFSIVDPTLYPQHLAHYDQLIQKGWTERDWMEFQYQKGWGTEKFEKAERRRKEKTVFPKPWDRTEHRKIAAQVVQDNLNSLYLYDRERLQVLQAGLEIVEIKEVSEWFGGVSFKVPIKNITEGHDVPTGFIAERPFFLHVVVDDSKGNRLFESGMLDGNGDYLDKHSRYVHNGELKSDPYLHTNQSKFLLRPFRGGSEVEAILAVNHYAGVLPFLRPLNRSEHFLGRPLGSRIHHRSIPALATCEPKKYHIKAEQMTENFPYKVTARYFAGMVPPNLIGAIHDTGIGFDYRMSPMKIAQRLITGVEVDWSYFKFPGSIPEIAKKLGEKPRDPVQIRAGDYPSIVVPKKGHHQAISTVGQMEGIGGLKVISKKVGYLFGK